MLRDAEIGNVMLSVMAVILVVTLLFHLTGDKQATPLEAALRKLKLASLSCGMVIFILLLCLPATGIYKHLTPERIKSLEDAARYQSDFGVDLDRIREILYWAFFTVVVWCGHVFNYLKVLTAERIKNSD